VTDAVTSRVKYRLHGHTGRINTVCVSDNAECFLSGSYDSTVKIWDGRSRSREPIQTLNDASDSITSVLTLQHRGGAEILTTSVDGFIRTYDLRMGRISKDNAGSPIIGCDITSISDDDGKYCIATSCLNGDIYLFEKNTGSLLKKYTGGHKAGNYGLDCCIMSNDLHVVSGSEDGCVVFYDLVSGKVAQKVDAKGGGGENEHPTCSIACCPKKGIWESMVLSASYDGQVLVWCDSTDHAQWSQVNNLDASATFY